MYLPPRLSELEELVRDAKSMPLSSSALVNRDEVLDLIEALKTSLPDEIKQARWVVKDREELLAKARRDAEVMVDQARARKLRLEAEDYVDAKLAQLEGRLQKILEEMIASNDGLSRTIDQVVGGREKLRGVPSAELGPDVALSDDGPGDGPDDRGTEEA